jgi:phosphoribosyl 1,2-cyclic phosphodiesterase
LSARLIASRLNTVGVQPGQLQGVLVTHEHSDHVIGLPTLMKRYDLPVIADPRTYQLVEDGIVSGLWRTDSGRVVSSAWENSSGPLLEAADAAGASELPEAASESFAGSIMTEERALHKRPLPVGASCVIGDIEVTSFPIPHDAVAPCGYLLEAGGCRVCVVTDSGEVTTTMLEMMQQADLLVLEANHDRERLLRGPYPQNLKRRILSATGHLSNDQAADAVLRIWRSDGVRWLWLSHLSRTNNTPSLALNSVRARFQAAGANLAQLHISVSPPGMGGLWDSTQLWQSVSLWEMER